MTEIIDFLKKYTDGKQNSEKVEISVLQLNRVIKALEKELCEDCISRKEALDLVEDMTDQFGVGHRVITEGMISMLPPVTPKPKADVLDKIRAEIKEESRFCPLTEGLERAIEIIDKYKAERNKNE